MCSLECKDNKNFWDKGIFIPKKIFYLKNVREIAQWKEIIGGVYVASGCGSKARREDFCG